ncbi:hypothetical protein CLF_103159 [Clonorchis sinensis]|uniref:Uncharacterized protein n=1 Tax=Clonorchis sinensis TaxID=79923 RepID=G7Y966_CLOSI|nr:hypothetical protein CLF_103159 [Clonorchis sinensis]
MLKENASCGSVLLGLSAYANCRVNIFHKNDRHGWNHVLHSVTMACLETLASWPQNHVHRKELCEGLCVPHAILGTAIDFARTEFNGDGLLLKSVLYLLDLIFARHPSNPSSVKRLQPVNTDPSSALTPAARRASAPSNVAEGCESKDTTAHFLLPPLATPLHERSIPFVDDSNFFCSSVPRRVFSSVRVPSNPPSNDLGMLSDDVYHPFSPIFQRRRIRARAESVEHSTPTRSLPRDDVPTSLSGSLTHSQLSTNDLPSLNTIADLFGSCTIGPTNGSLKAGDSRYPSTTCPTVSRYPASDHQQENLTGTHSLSSGTSATESRTQLLSADPDDLILASQLALLFLPPLLYTRLQVLVHLLRRVLDNHVNVAVALSPSGANRANDEHSNTYEFVLNTLAKFSAPVLFPSLGVTDGVGINIDEYHWTEQLARLLLSDHQNLVFKLPLTILSSVKPPMDRNGLTSLPSSPLDKCLSSLKYVHNSESISRVLRSAPCFGNSFRSASLSVLPATARLLQNGVPKCIPSIVLASQESSHISSGQLSTGWLASTPKCTDFKELDPQLPHYQSPNRTLSQSCHYSLTDIHSSGSTTQRRSCNGPDHEWPGSSASETTSLQVDFDPERLALLNNAVHLMKLLNQIINDRQMDPRRKMKCLLDFRKVHPDIFWLRFRDQQTASYYLNRLQRRIDAQPQPTILEKITNAFRRRRQSPPKEYPSSKSSTSSL